MVSIVRESTKAKMMEECDAEFQRIRENNDDDKHINITYKTYKHNNITYKHHVM